MMSRYGGMDGTQASRVPLAFAVALMSLCWASVAQASLFGGSAGLNPEFCKDKTFRQTVVYIDDTLMKTGQNSWALDLNNRLDGSLMPGERVTVVQLSPSSGTSREIWSGCWPAYTPAQRAEIEKKSYFFSSNPLRDLKDQRSYFTLDFGEALTKIYTESALKPASYKIDSSDPPTKNIIAALASDGARFNESETTIRAIVYSDLAQNSKIASVFAAPQAPAVNFGQELGVYFPHSVFYLYGAGNDVGGAGTFLGTARTFWSQVLGSMNATIEAVGSDLVIPNRIPVKDYNYRLSLDRNGEKLFGRMSLLVDEDGHLVDSWIGISRLSFVAIQGTFNCSADASGCVLHATTNGSLTTTSSEETIDLSGSDAGGLKGTVGVRGALTFNMAAQVATN